MNLGEKIKKYRKENGLNIAELAKKASLSASYISQLERGLVFPSLAALQKIANGLNLHMPDFFEYPVTAQNSKPRSEVTESKLQVVRKNSRKGLVYSGSNVIYQLLTPDLRRNIELIKIEAPIGSNSGTENFLHNGEECGFILQGKMEYWVDGETVLLEEGDSVYFRSNLPHRWRNIGDGELIAIWVITPPSF